MSDCIHGKPLNGDCLECSPEIEMAETCTHGVTYPGRCMKCSQGTPRDHLIELQNRLLKNVSHHGVKKIGELNKNKTATFNQQTVGHSKRAVLIRYREKIVRMHNHAKAKDTRWDVVTDIDFMLKGLETPKKLSYHELINECKEVLSEK